MSHTSTNTSSNTAVGFNSLFYTTGDYNTAVGFGAATQNISGTYNTAIGVNALSVSVSGGSNTACGTNALRHKTDVNGCSAFGTNALYNTTTGYSNTAVGMSSLYRNVTGHQNVAVGHNALVCVTTGNFNVGIGTGAGTFYDSTIGDLSGFSTGSYNVCIGAGSQASRLDVGNEVSIYNGSVHARFQGSASSWTFPSDERDKTAIEDLTLGLDFITRLRPRKFQWNLRHQTEKEGKEASGFIAQEVLALVEATDSKYTDLVNTSNENQYSLAQTNLIPMLVNAIKELTARLEILEAR